MLSIHKIFSLHAHTANKKMLYLVWCCNKFFGLVCIELSLGFVQKRGGGGYTDERERWTAVTVASSRTTTVSIPYKFYLFKDSMKIIYICSSIHVQKHLFYIVLMGKIANVYSRSLGPQFLYCILVILWWILIFQASFCFYLNPASNHTFKELIELASQKIAYVW